jgi:hypothetical protein
MTAADSTAVVATSIGSRESVTVTVHVAVDASVRQL